jgi:hypothetical protein
MLYMAGGGFAPAYIGEANPEILKVDAIVNCGII